MLCCSRCLAWSSRGRVVRPDAHPVGGSGGHRCSRLSTRIYFGAVFPGTLRRAGACGATSN
eukprot:1928375-Pyramimonas_sp.AAC.1